LLADVFIESTSYPLYTIGKHLHWRRACVSSRNLDGARLDESLAPCPHVGIVRDQLPARFDEGDGGGAGEGDAVILEEGFERAKKVSGSQESCTWNASAAFASAASMIPWK
jgi:hypothetical protein